MKSLGKISSSVCVRSLKCESCFFIATIIIIIIIIIIIVIVIIGFD